MLLKGWQKGSLLLGEFVGRICPSSSLFSEAQPSRQGGVTPVTRSNCRRRDDDEADRVSEG
jgi:hypothetical protein